MRELLTVVMTMTLAGFTLVGCGQNGPVRLSPTSADAKNFPAGVVSFTATGVSSPVWCIGTSNGACNGNIAPVATIDSSGRAQCIQGQSGTVSVLAGRVSRVGLPDTGQQLSPFGTAQLTCP